MSPAGPRLVAAQPLGRRRRARAGRGLGADRPDARRRARRPAARRRALVAFHEQTANAALVAIALHGVTLLGDTFLNPASLASPCRSRSTTGRSTSRTGIIGGYLAAALGLSFYARTRIGGKRWRKLHRATPLVYVLGLDPHARRGHRRRLVVAARVHARHRRPGRGAARHGLRKARLIRSPKAANISVSPTEI